MNVKVFTENVNVDVTFSHLLCTDFCVDLLCLLSCEHNFRVPSLRSDNYIVTTRLHYWPFHLYGIITKIVKWSMKLPYSIQWDPMEMFCSRPLHTNVTLMIRFDLNMMLISYIKITSIHLLRNLLYALQEVQTIRTFAIYQMFLRLKLLLWAMEKFTFSSIQPISVKISGKYIYWKI